MVRLVAAPFQGFNLRDAFLVPGPAARAIAPPPLRGSTADAPSTTHGPPSLDLLRLQQLHLAFAADGVLEAGPLCGARPDLALRPQGDERHPGGVRAAPHRHRDHALDRQLARLLRRPAAAHRLDRPQAAADADDP